MAVEQAVNQATNTAKSWASYAWSTFRTLAPLTTVFMGVGMLAGGGSSVLAALPAAKDVTLGTLGKVAPFLYDMVINVTQNKH